MKNLTKRGLPYRRKIEGRTDYLARLNLLKSGKPRIVVRRSLKNIVIQFIEFHPDGDKVLCSTSSKELVKEYGIKGSLKNIPVSYLTGLLAGKKAAKLKISGAIPDLGIRKPHTGGAVFAALKGLIDSGIDIPHKEDSEKKSVFPSEDRIKGDHVKIKNDYEGIKNKIIK